MTNKCKHCTYATVAIVLFSSYATVIKYLKKLDIHNI